MKKSYLFLIPLIVIHLIYPQSVDVKDGDGNSLITINDEGDNGGSITLPDAVAVSVPTNKLYNLGSSLYWNGSEVGLGAGVNSINDLLDGYSDGSSVALGFSAGVNDGGGNRNTFIGIGTGNANTIGMDNTFIGHNAGNKTVGQGTHPFGWSNTFVGSQAGMSNINGSGNVFIGMHAGSDNTNGFDNIFIGEYAGTENTVGYRNIIMGKQSGQSILDGNNNTIIGNHAGFFLTSGSSNILIGDDAGGHTTQSQSVFIGRFAGYENTTGFDNNYIGYGAGWNNSTGGSNVVIGNFADRWNQGGADNVIIGRNAGSGSFESYHSKSGCILIGNSAGYGNSESNKLYIENSSSSTPLIWGDFNTDDVRINGNMHITGDLTVDGSSPGGSSSIDDLNDGKTGGSSVFLGENAGLNDDGNNRVNTAVGFDALRTNVSSALNNAFGQSALRNNTGGNSNVAIGTQSQYENTIGYANVCVGNESNRYNQEGVQNTLIGHQAGMGTDLHSKSYNVLIGHTAGYKSIADFNTYIGTYSGYETTTGNSNTFIGFSAGGGNIDGSDNVFIGSSTGGGNQSGNQNVFVGKGAGNNGTSADYNTFIGHAAGSASNANGNTFVGYTAGINNGTGTGNTFLGAWSGFNSSGYSNIFIGRQAGYSETGSNKLYIESSNSSTPLIGGDFSIDEIYLNGKVGIGTTSPSHELSVNGIIQAKEVLVETGWSDYVFEDAYNLKSLSEVEQFIGYNGHLPEIPSTKEVEQNGISLGEMDSKLLMKIEELTLYLIEQDKQIQDLKYTIENISEKLNKQILISSK